MTTQEKLIRHKISLLELAEYLKNVSEACRVMGVSRQHFYDVKNAHEEGGIEGLREKSRRKPCLKNRVAPEVEESVAGRGQEMNTPTRGNALREEHLYRYSWMALSWQKIEAYHKDFRGGVCQLKYRLLQITPPGT